MKKIIAAIGVGLIALCIVLVVSYWAFNTTRYNIRADTDQQKTPH